jgi:hypothetical protein
MRITILQDGKIVNIIEATSLKVAQQFYPDCRVALDTDTIEPAQVDPDAALRAQFEAEQAAKAEAEFDSFKARSGAPTYKSAAVKIAAEKLGLLAAIEAAIMALVDKASDKALYVWWVETDTISRGDAQWIAIEPAVSWGKSSADELFALAAQV